MHSKVNSWSGYTAANPVAHTGSGANASLRGAPGRTWPPVHGGSSPVTPAAPLRAPGMTGSHRKEMRSAFFLLVKTVSRNFRRAQEMETCWKKNCWQQNYSRQEFTDDFDLSSFYYWTSLLIKPASLRNQPWIKKIFKTRLVTKILHL